VTEAPRPARRRLSLDVVRGLFLLLGDEDRSADQRADELALGKARAWLRDVAQRGEAHLRPRGRRT
jgi:hypothetical protein